MGSLGRSSRECFSCGFIGSWRVRSPRVWVPRAVRRCDDTTHPTDLRQFLTALDVYCALLITILAAYLRFAGELRPIAHDSLTMLMVVDARRHLLSPSSASMAKAA